MTQEEKQLLLRDLCARLPYGLQIHITSDECDDGFQSGEFDNTLRYHHLEAFVCDRIEIKPYLRPMSSMTEEERRYLLEEFGFDEDLENWELNDFGSYVYRNVNVLPLFDWLNAHHFDYRGLIEKGLALEAPEGMYNSTNNA